MTSQSELSRKFFMGETSGSASNVRIVDRGDTTALVGYGHAVYAERDKSSGEVTYYRGWYGYSQSTSIQLTKMELEDYADKTVDRQKSL